MDLDMDYDSGKRGTGRQCHVLGRVARFVVSFCVIQPFRGLPSSFFSYKNRWKRLSEISG